MKAISTLVLLLFVFNHPLYSQSNWWDDLDLPKDTIFLYDCNDLDFMIDNNNLSPLNELVFPSGIDDPAIIATYKINKELNEDSICVGGVISITFLNWNNSETYEYDRIISLNPNLSGPCGEVFSLVFDDIENGILISDLDSAAVDISFNAVEKKDTLFLQANIGDEVYVPIFQVSGSSFCYVKIQLEAPCPREFFIEATDLSVDFGTILCRKIYIDEVVLHAEYECADFQLGFLDDDKMLKDHYFIVHDYRNPNKNQEVSIAIKAEDGEEYETTFEVPVFSDQSKHKVYLYSEDPFLSTGEITYVGIGGDIEMISRLEATLWLQDVSILDVQQVHPALQEGRTFQYFATENVFFFIFSDPEPIFTSIDNLPWFVLKIEATRDGRLSDFLYVRPHDRSVTLTLDSTFCQKDTYVRFPFEFSQDLLFTNTSESITKSQIQLFPNPTTEKIYFDHDLDKIQEVKVYDMSGKLILSKEKLDNYLNVSQLNPGLYKMVLTTQKGVTTGGFIKQ